MAVYTEVDPKFLRRYFDLLSKHGRAVDKKYGNHKCGKEVFVERTLNKWLVGKCFVVIHQDSAGQWASKDPTNPNSYYEIKWPRKHFVRITGCAYQLGYSEKIDIYVHDPFESKVFNSKEFSYNDFLRLQFREITDNEFKSVSTLFNDDRDETEYEMIAYTKKYTPKGRLKKPQEVKVKVMAKDYREAREKAVELHPELVIYG